MTDVIPEPDPRIVREVARQLLLNAASEVAMKQAGPNIGAACHATAGPGGLGMLEYSAWFQAVYEAMKTAQFGVSWPDEQTDIEPDLSGWSAAENAEFEKLYGVQAAMRLRAAHDRVWQIVKELREAAVADGRDPYRDPMAQRLSAALVGADGDGCLCPHTYQPDGALVRDGVLALGCPTHDPDAGENGNA